MTSHKYVMTWNTGGRLLWPSKVTGDPGKFFLKSQLTVSFPSENYFQNFGENPINSLTRLPQGGPSYKIPSFFSPGGIIWEVIVRVCCPALQILTLLQSNSYKVNVREYSPETSYIKKWRLSIIDLVTAKHFKWRQPHPRRHRGQLVGMIGCVKVYCKIETSPWHLLLPNQFAKRTSEWPEKKFLANQRRGTARWLWCFLTWHMFPHRLPLLSSPFNWKSFSREVSEKMLTNAEKFQKSCKLTWRSKM